MAHRQKASLSLLLSVPHILSALSSLLPDGPAPCLELHWSQCDRKWKQQTINWLRNWLLFMLCWLHRAQGWSYNTVIICPHSVISRYAEQTKLISSLAEPRFLQACSPKPSPSHLDQFSTFSYAGSNPWISLLLHFTTNVQFFRLHDLH